MLLLQLTATGPESVGPEGPPTTAKHSGLRRNLRGSRWPVRGPDFIRNRGEFADRPGSPPPVPERPD
ncbi:DUF6053 domain-containing protein [Lysobacter enzymogenes]|uniref:DUF6053 domain-containing protein n=1 Tax=Lysobacter enzymogenes TaxID=69 RepID=UPI003D18782F